MRNSFVRVLAAGAMVVGAVGVAGCTSDEPDPEPTAETEAVTSSPEPTMDPPVELVDKPAEWADSGETGAAAAAVWFIRDAYRYVVETNDTEEWVALSSPECQFCGNITKHAQDAAAAQETLRLDGEVGVAVTRVERLNPLAYSVVLDVDAFVMHTYGPDGTPPLDETSPEGQLLIDLHREGPDWQLRAAQYFAAGEDVPSVLDEQ